MSVKLMSAIFETEFRDLIDGEGNTTKASTAKLVLLALADHANDEGESAYPSVDRLARKTALSSQTVRNTFDALKYNGIVRLEGLSKYRTNNYTISLLAFPKLRGDDNGILTLNPLDPQMSEVTPSNGSLLTLNPLDPNHHITTTETPTADFSEIEEKANQAVDQYLAMANFPGAKNEVRVDSILSYLGETLHRDTSASEWRKFAKKIDSDKQLHGWDVKQFIAWLLSQPDYKPQFWPVKKMMEFYPSAFTESGLPAVKIGSDGIPETY